jgi:hypothetical protein
MHNDPRKLVDATNVRLHPSSMTLMEGAASKCSKCAGRPRTSRRRQLANVPSPDSPSTLFLQFAAAAKVAASLAVAVAYPCPLLALPEPVQEHSPPAGRVLAEHGRGSNGQEHLALLAGDVLKAVQNVRYW